jgi:hypothetical protein
METGGAVRRRMDASRSPPSSSRAPPDYLDRAPSSLPVLLHRSPPSLSAQPGRTWPTMETGGVGRGVVRRRMDASRSPPSSFRAPPDYLDRAPSSLPVLLHPSPLSAPRRRLLIGGQTSWGRERMHLRCAAAIWLVIRAPHGAEGIKPRCETRGRRRSWILASETLGRAVFRSGPWSF